ncbi:MAG: hypothetical protein PHY95_00810 [Candidatus ainarchaeum sp.]|nr:hypothetical protein [Candidatus ainarchaeum sp.]
MPDDKDPRKNGAPVAFASITTTKRAVPPRPHAGAGKYRAPADEEPASLTTANVVKASCLTGKELGEKGTPGGDRVSKMKERLAGIKTHSDCLSDRLADDSGNPIDKFGIAASILFMDACPSEARIETPKGPEDLKAMVLYCGGAVMRSFLFTNASFEALKTINPAIRHQLSEERSITLITPAGKLWYIFLAPAGIGKSLAGPSPQPEESCGSACTEALRLYVSGKGKHPSGIDFPAVSPKPKDPYVTDILPPRELLMGARVVSSTLEGVTIDELRDSSEPVPGSRREEKLAMRNGSAHTFIGGEITLNGKRYMVSNTLPDILADHGATGYLVTSNRMKASLVGGGTVYIIEVCEDASTLRLFESPRGDGAQGTEQVPLFENPYEAVQWAARRAASMAGGRLAKQAIFGESIVVLVAAPDDEFFIITNGSVSEACSELAKRSETETEEMLVTPGLLDLRSAPVALQSGEIVSVKIIPSSVKISRKPELNLPPSPMAQNGAAAPSMTGTTEVSALIALNVGLPTDKEGVAALLKGAVMPTPQPVLHGDEMAKDAFMRKSRFLRSIAGNVRSVFEHNTPSDQLIFTTVRVDIGGQGLSFNLFRLRNGADGLSPALLDFPQSFIFTDSVGWYIMVPTHRTSDLRKPLMESTMTR